MYRLFLFTLLVCCSSLFAIKHVSIERLELSTRPIVIGTKRIFLGLRTVFNPSLIRTKEGFLLTFRYMPQEKQKSWLSKIGVVQLNADLVPVSDPVILKTRPKGSPISSQAEDARIFEWRNRLFLTYSDNDEIDHPGFTDRRDIFLAELFFENHTLSLGTPKKMRHQEKYSYTGVQKNWVPFVWKDQLFLGYSISPHEILMPDLQSGDCTRAYETSVCCNWEWGEIRGGTPAILVDGEYLAFFHSSIHAISHFSLDKEKLHYFMGAYTFKAEPPFEVTRISPHPIVHRDFYSLTEVPKKVVFPGGFAVTDDKIYLAYGKDDKEVWIAVLNKAALLDSLVPLF